MRDQNSSTSTGPGAHRWFRVAGPVGEVFVAHDSGWVTGLALADGVGDDGDGFEAWMRQEVGAEAIPDSDPDPAFVELIRAALDEGRTDVPVDLESRTPFHREVLEHLLTIPKGEVRTYGQVAAAVGRPRAHRAVGSAVARNPVSLLVPCHRVVPAAGGVGNYGSGPHRKEALLNREGARLSSSSTTAS